MTEFMGQHSRFHLVYDGPALDEHRMDVRALAPALLAMGDLVERANMILNGEQVKVSVDVHASFKAGSFGIDMELAQSLWQKVLDLAGGQSVVSIATICTLLGFSVRDSCKGVIQVIKWLRGRGVTRIEPLESGVVRLFVGDEHMDTEERVLKLVQDYKLRKALEGVITEPLEREGITSVSTVESDQVIMHVERSESHYFKTPAPQDETLGEDTYIANLQVLNLAFQDDNKWRFTEGGGNVFYATVLDSEFLKRVQLNLEQFAKDDIIRASVRRTQRITKDGLRAEYEVLKVMEHRSATPKVQLKMDLNPDDN
ncbi:hypothetical protein [Pseudomonas cichorii]|uniref:hypothetical protein n=1 Tax=Pseudomonas cichorii TaxID=36746 RepID=UPI001C89AA28|nr:hypothetical protein [Pseudomonas cichorii]MBX8484151.1 hypothetical protein [Pseudomonas cichorii]MBX8573999.1 hypothetical protein [Pseudomonas cichorii]